jgi:hypothetical protein
MKSVTAVLLFLFLSAAGLFAADPVFEPPFVPASPEVLAQGGSFVANAGGYNSLFFNPAGFSAGERSVTVLSATSWVYANPLRFLNTLGTGDSSAIVGLVEDEATSGGFGFGAAAGIGYVGHGLGLAAVLNIDSYLYGPTLLGAEGDLHATLGFVAGFSLPVQLFGIKVHLGASLRPMLRVSAPVDYTTMLDVLQALGAGGDPLAPLAGADAVYGYGFGLDLGTIIELGDLRVGLAVRDLLGTSFSYTQTTVGAILDSIGSSTELPTGGGAVDGHLIPMNVAAGLSYHPDLGGFSNVLDPTVHVSLDDVVGVFRDGRSVWTLLHLGAEARILRFLSLRGGIQQGYVTFGAGLELLFLEVNAAVFTRELGMHIGDRPSSGMTVEAAVRF